MCAFTQTLDSDQELITRQIKILLLISKELYIFILLKLELHILVINQLIFYGYI